MYTIMYTYVYIYIYIPHAKRGGAGRTATWGPLKKDMCCVVLRVYVNCLCVVV